MEAAEASALAVRWGGAMRVYTEDLRRLQTGQHGELVATLTVLELPNLFALLEQVNRSGDAAATIHLATSLFDLLRNAGKPRLLARVTTVLDAAAAALAATWNHTSFEAQRTRIEEQLANSRLSDAFDGAQQLLHRARAAGDKAYPGADYDLAAACFLQARLFWAVGASEQALPLLDEAQKRFETIQRDAPGPGAEQMVSACLTEQGDCLRNLGRLDQAAAVYEESIRRSEKIGRIRDVAVVKIQLGTIRMIQNRYKEALEAYEEARERFTRLDEPGTVAVTWHQTGMVYQRAGQPEAAEDAYRKSLTIEVRLGNVAGQADTLLELGNLYDEAGRLEEAAAFSLQAADKYVEIRDVAREGSARNNLADTLRKLGRFDEARQEILRAIEGRAQFGRATEPWSSWYILAHIEMGAGNAAAATATLPTPRDWTTQWPPKYYSCSKRWKAPVTPEPTGCLESTAASSGG